MYASNGERIWAMLAHWLTLISSATGLGCIPPLVIYMVKKNESRFVAFHALQSLYLHLIVLLGLLLLGVSLHALHVLTFGLVSWFLWPLKFLRGIPFVLFVLYILYAGLRAKRGEMFEYVVAGPIARGTVGI